LAAFALVVASLFVHAYSIRYSFRKAPAPNVDKLWSLAQIHFISTLVCFVYVLSSLLLHGKILKWQIHLDHLHRRGSSRRTCGFILQRSRDVVYYDREIWSGDILGSKSLVDSWVCCHSFWVGMWGGQVES